MGAPGDDEGNPDAGVVYVVHGDSSMSGYIQEDWVVLYDDDDGSMAGTSVRGIGDYDADGLDDLLIANDDFRGNYANLSFLLLSGE